MFHLYLRPCTDTAPADYKTGFRFYKQVASSRLVFIQRIHRRFLFRWDKRGAYKTSDRNKKVLLLSTVDAWNKFKLHTVNLEDEVMRERLDTLIASIPDSQTSFGVEIHYHRRCWRKYVSDNKSLSEDSIQHLQRVNLREAQVLFFHHVRQLIFKDHQIRTLQALLHDYNRIISNHGHNSIVKSSYLKEILIKEFGEDIGFHKRFQENVSQLVYDSTAAGIYIEAVISSLGVTNDQLAMNVVTQLKLEVIKTNPAPWRPYAHELGREEDLSELLLKFMTWLKHPRKYVIDNSPSVRSIASTLTSDITGKRTAFVMNLSLMLHELTKSRQEVDIMHKDGLGISYNDVLVQWVKRMLMMDLILTIFVRLMLLMLS